MEANINADVEIIEINGYLAVQLIFPDQNVKDMPTFQNYKMDQINKLGKHALQFECLGDNLIYFEEYTKPPGYFSQCPKCQEYVCPFCAYLSYGASSIKCCLKRSIYTKLFFEAPIFTIPGGEGAVDLFEKCSFFNPFWNFFKLFRKFNEMLFTNISKYSAIKKGEIIKFEADKLRYKYFLYSIGCPYVLIYFFYYLAFLFILLLISIPSKYYPFKYLYCFLYYND